MTIDEMASMALLYGPLVLMVVGTIATVYHIWREWGTGDRMDDIVEKDPAFDVDLSIESIRQEPERLDAIADRVESVCIQRQPQGSAGGKGGASMEVYYSTYAIDINGCTHDIARGTDWARVERAGERVAHKLEVPFRDVTYGGGGS